MLAARSRQPMENRFLGRLHHALPPMEKMEHGEGVELADKNTGSLAQDPLLAVTAERWKSDAASCLAMGRRGGGLVPGTEPRTLQRALLTDRV